MSTQLYLPALSKAIVERLQGDATLVALLGGSSTPEKKLRITNTFPLVGVDPAGTTFPYVTFYCSGGVVDDPMDGRRDVVTLEVRFRVEEQPAAGGDSLLTSMKIQQRIVGDFPAQTAAAGPSYGLDRWTPPAFTGGTYTGDYDSAYAAETMVLRSWNDITDMESGGVREWLMTFECGIDKGR